MGLLVGSNSTFDSSNLDGEDGFSVSGLTADNPVGTSVTGVGDIDGDGFGDFVIGGGSVSYLVYGFHDPDTGAYSLDNARLAGVPITLGGQVLGQVGDLDGDGYDDLVIGNPAAGSGAGAVSIVFGKAERFSGSIDMADRLVVGEAAGDQFGASLAGVNLNYDRFDDLVVGAPGAQGGEGRVYVLFGTSDVSEAGLAGSFYDSGELSCLDAALAYIAGHDSDATFVSSELNYPSSVDRLDDDNALSTYLEDDAASLNGTDAASLDGSVFRYDSFLIVREAGTYQFKLGSDDQARLTINGDVVLDNSGGFKLPATSYTFDAAGLYAISLVHDEIGGSTGIILESDLSGSMQALDADFLARSAPWDLTQLDGTTGLIIAGEAGAALGTAVADAGDVNDDTVPDAILGAPGADAAYVLLGSTSPYTQTIALSEFSGRGVGVTLQGEADSQAGLAVDGAGDVNGDGIDDVVLGAPQADPGGHADAGKTYIVFGSTRAFPSTVDLTELDASDGVVLDGVSAGDVSGAAVAGPGDIDGDGYADVLVGAPMVEVNGQAQEGTVYLGFGGEDPGAASGQDFSQLDRVLAITRQEANAYLGAAVSGLGDINDDEAPDLILGAPGSDGGAGRAYLLFGVDPKAQHVLLADLTESAANGEQKFDQASSLPAPTPLSGRPEVKVWGAVGALLGGVGAVATADIQPTVAAFIGVPDNPGASTGAQITASDEVYIEAFSATDVDAASNGYLISLVGGGGGAAKTYVNMGSSDTPSTTEAYVSNDAQVEAQGGDFTLLARSFDTVEAHSTAISSGFVAELQARTFPTLARFTQTYIGSFANIAAGGDVKITALKSTNLIARAKAGAVGGVVVSTTIVDANVGLENGKPTILSFISVGSSITSNGENGVVVNATNSLADDLSVTATSDSYGFASGQKASATLTLNEVAQVINQGTYHNTSGLSNTARLDWKNVYVYATSRTRSLVGIPTADATLQGTVQSQVLDTATGVTELEDVQSTQNLKNQFLGPIVTLRTYRRYSVFFAGINKHANGDSKITVLPAPATASPQILSAASDATEVNIASTGDVVTLTATYTDDPSDTHTALVDWGDGTGAHAATIVQEEDQFRVKAFHVYSAGGVYPITLTVTDDTGLLDTESTTATISGIGMVDGTLHVVGTHAADSVNITVIDGVLEVISSFDVFYQPEILVDQVHIALFGGDDVAFVDDAVPPAVAIDGGEGVDTFTSDAPLIVGPDGTFRVEGSDIVGVNFEVLSGVTAIAGSDDADTISIFSDHLVVNGSTWTLIDTGDVTIRSGDGDDQINFPVQGDRHAKRRITVVDIGGNDTYAFNASDVRIDLQDQDGFDTLDFSSLSSAITLRLARDNGTPQNLSASGIRLGLTGTFEGVMGTATDDVIIGNDADNMLLGGAGNDRLDGGKGFDVALYSGPSSNYDVKPPEGSGKTIILDWSGEEGEDELKDVEQLIFDHPQSKGSVQGSSGANFPEFVWVGFDNKQENEEATFEPLGQIDWHMEIGEK